MTIDPARIAEHFLVPHKRREVRAIAQGCAQIRQTILQHASGGACCSEGGIVELVRERAEAAFGDVLRANDVPKQLVLDFVDACDAESRTVRYATWDALRRQCDGVGGAAAVMIAFVLGVAHSDVRAQAIALGRAARLIAIVTQLKADVANGRIYLPLEDLTRCRYSESDLRRGVVNDRLREVVAMQISRAREAIKMGSAGLCWLPRDKARIAAAAYVSLQLALLDEIARVGGNVFDARPALTPARALRRLPGAWRLARRRHDEALPRV